MKAAVFGAGSWGTTFAKVLVDAGTPVTLWARRPGLARAIRDGGRNEAYLPGVDLPEGLHATHDAGEALAGADLVAFAVPAQSLRENLSGWAGLLPPGATLVSLMKGIELGTVKRMSEVIAEVAGADPGRVAVVTGPNLAGRSRWANRPPPSSPASTTTGPARCRPRAARPTSVPTRTPTWSGANWAARSRTSSPWPAECVRAWASATTPSASLMTRGLAETARLGAALGADPRTFAGLAGMGDLVATCASPLSRNRSFGERLGRGETVEQAQAAAHGQVAEGSSRAARSSTWPAGTVSTSRSPPRSNTSASAAAARRPWCAP